MARRRAIVAAKLICLFCATLAAAALAATTPPDADTKLREKEAAEQLERDRIRQRIVLNIDRLKHCVAPAGVCVQNEIPRLLLGLTRSEIEAILGPPQYQLRLAGNHLFYWTVPLKSNQPGGAIRVQVSFGRCYYREQNSSKDAVCDAAVQ